ncbi:hypothetical protein [Skermania piniformis]|uniref:LtfC/p132/Gp6 beta-sandwich domain-containing protein n=1 Tax=Skermania pinensis TaxID=39122 RepID=A0ABX8SAI6_9ACTN|nr:hypothetical protein [Skermania piniformis]QXQ14827.1 hypothetical protein KV203_05450 [Skermania piniformis]
MAEMLDLFDPPLLRALPLTYGRDVRFRLVPRSTATWPVVPATAAIWIGGVPNFTVPAGTVPDPAEVQIYPGEVTAAAIDLGFESEIADTVAGKLVWRIRLTFPDGTPTGYNDVPAQGLTRRADGKR